MNTPTNIQYPSLSPKQLYSVELNLTQIDYIRYLVQTEYEWLMTHKGDVKCDASRADVSRVMVKLDIAQPLGSVSIDDESILEPGFDRTSDYNH